MDDRQSQTSPDYPMSSRHSTSPRLPGHSLPHSCSPSRCHIFPRQENCPLTPHRQEAIPPPSKIRRPLLLHAPPHRHRAPYSPVPALSQDSPLPNPLCRQGCFRCRHRPRTYSSRKSPR